MKTVVREEEAGRRRYENRRMNRQYVHVFCGVFDSSPFLLRDLAFLGKGTFPAALFSFAGKKEGVAPAERPPTF